MAGAGVRALKPPDRDVARPTAADRSSSQEALPRRGAAGQRPWPHHLALLPALPGEMKHALVARTLRAAINRGVLPEGTRLPGHRQLAQHLGVARNTVVDALQSLEAEGYVQVRGRSGTVTSVPAWPVPPPAASSTQTPNTLSPTTLPLSAWATRALAGQVPDAGGDYAVDFRVGQSVPELYPQVAWARALARRAERIVPTLPGEGEATSEHDPWGPLETRRALAAYLNAERGAQVTPDMIMLTGGTQSALDALARVFLEAGRTVAVEDPTYPGARSALAATGAAVLPVPVDALGLRPDDLPTQATLVYVTPGCQYPTTVPLTAARRQALMVWARSRHAFILEDDYAADLHHAARPAPVMQGLAPDRVILLGSFSKSLAPVTRSGYLVAPPEVTQVLAGTRPLTDRVPGTLDALALADVLASGAYARHLRRAQQVIGHRQDVLLSALRGELPTWQARPTQAGLHLYVPLPAGTEESQVVRQAARLGVAVTPLTPLSAGPHPPALLLAFAHLSPERLREGVRRLALIGGWP